MADQQRDRGVTLADGTVIAQIASPPTVVVLVSNNQKADIHWKDYVFSLFDYVTALSYASSQFTAPNMTTTERNAMTAVNGMIIYNTTTTQFEFYENGSWVTK